MPDNRKLRQPPRVTGHRGAGGERPENTIAAFRHAAEIGCDAVELDVHLSADGVPVVVHDATIERADGSRARVEVLSASDLLSIEVGDGERIPTLADVLALLAPTSLDVQVELKGVGVIESTVEEVRKIGMESRVVFTSFHHRRVLEARRLLPEVRAGILLSSVPVDIVSVARAAKVDNVHLQINRINAEVVEIVQTAGLRLVAWGAISSEEQFDRLFELGVDAIGSDWPSRLLARRAAVFGR